MKYPHIFFLFFTIQSLNATFGIQRELSVEPPFNSRQSSESPDVSTNNIEETTSKLNYFNNGLLMSLCITTILLEKSKQNPIIADNLITLRCIGLFIETLNFHAPPSVKIILEYIKTIVCFIGPIRYWKNAKILQLEIIFIISYLNCTKKLHKQAFRYFSET